MSQRPAPRPARLLAVSSLAHFMNDGVVFFIPVIGDLLTQDHKTSATVITAMLTIFYITSAGFGIVVGLLADRIGRRGAIIATGIATLGVSLVGFYASLSIAGLGSDILALVAAGVAGIGSSAYHPLGGSVLQRGFAAKARGRALGVNGAFGSLGRALYPTLFFVIAALGISRPATTLVFAGLSVLAAAAIALGLPSESIEVHHTAPTIPQTSGTATEAQTAVITATPNPGIPAPSPPLRSLLNRSVVALTTIAFFRSIAFIGIVSWIPIYLTTQRHAGISTGLGMTVTVMYAGGIIGQPIFGLLADRFDKRVVLAIDSLGSALGIFLFLATSGTGAEALVALALFGLFTFSGFPLLLSLVADYVPRGSFATGNAVVWGIGSTGGQALGPITASLLTGGSHTNLGMAFAILGAVAAATVLATPLLKRTAGSTRMAIFG